MNNRVYLDNAATTPIDPEVVQHIAEAMNNLWGNPSSIYQEGRTARAAVERARKTIANILNASIGEIFFTSGGTESNNMILKCAVRDLGVTRIITSKTEHHAVLHTAESIHNSQSVGLEFVNQDHRGMIDMEHLKSLLENSDQKTLVTLMHANNEIGTMIDLVEVGQLCEANGAYFHSDTVQTVGFYPIDLDKTPIHFITGSGHKFHGPKGTGFLYMNSEAILKPFIEGGAQERNMRGGTENVYGIIGMAKALEIANEKMEERRQQVKELRDYFADKIKATLPSVEFNGCPFSNGHFKTLSVSFPESDKNELLLLNLDIEGISCSGGSACSSGADKGSHVIEAIHPGTKRKTVRFSFSHHNTKSEADFVADKLKAIVED